LPEGFIGKYYADQKRTAGKPKRRYKNIVKNLKTGKMEDGEIRNVNDYQETH
jgi:hypothetical protein